MQKSLRFIEKALNIQWHKKGIIMKTILGVLVTIVVILGMSMFIIGSREDDEMGAW